MGDLKGEYQKISASKELALNYYLQKWKES